MSDKKIRIPVITGVILYGIALIIDLGGIFFQRSVIMIMGGGPESANIDTFIFPLSTVLRIIVMIMYIVFMLVMLKYIGAYRQVAGILMITVYCIVNISSPFIDILDNALTSRLKGADELAALSAINSFKIFTSPFAVVASVFILIAIGRYGISTENQESKRETQEGQ